MGVLPAGDGVFPGPPGAHRGLRLGRPHTLVNYRCRTCGIATHWEPTGATPGARHGVNLRNFEPALLASVTVRRFDGAQTWTYLD